MHLTLSMTVCYALSALPFCSGVQHRLLSPNFHFQCQFGCVSILELSSIISCQNLNGVTGLITGHLSS